MDSKKKMREAVWERFRIMQRLENGTKKEEKKRKDSLDRYYLITKEVI